MINKEDFEALHWIEFMCFNDPKRLSEQMNLSEREAEKKLRELEKKGLIKIELRDGEIYGSQLTEKGLKIWNNKRYLKWKLEFGY